MKLKMAIAAAAALVCSVSVAPAADILGKALAGTTSPCVVGTTATPTSCSGFYVGGGIGGVGTNADIVGNGLNGSVFAGGGVPYLDVGYQYVQGNWMFGAEVAAGGQVSTNTSVAGTNGNQNGFFSYQIAEVGGNINALFGNNSPVTIPPVLASSFITAGGLIGTAEHQFGAHLATGWASGAFAMFDISSHWFLKLQYLNIQYGSQQNGALTFNSENLVMAGINYKF